jgi:hypothetical protein
MGRHGPIVPCLNLARVPNESRPSIRTYRPRQGLRLYWRWSPDSARPENTPPGAGAELRLLGYEVAALTVATYIRRASDDPLTAQRFQGRKSRRYAGTTVDWALASSTR